MTESENSLKRWSKRKLAKGEPAMSLAEQNRRTRPEPSAPTVAHGASPAEDKAFDPASLPPIESIGADTDVTAFLRPGVPPELTRAALRRAWSADPAIRDFVGLVESGWDFNDPQAMSGFGPIDGNEVARLAGQIIGGLPAESESGEQKAVGRGEYRDAVPQISEHEDADAPENEERGGENDAPHKNRCG